MVHGTVAASVKLQELFGLAETPKVGDGRVPVVLHLDHTKVMDVTGVFVAIGHDPRSELVRGQVDTDEAGYVRVEAPTTRTGIPGVFICSAATPPGTTRPPSWRRSSSAQGRASPWSRSRPRPFHRCGHSSFSWGCSWPSFS